MLRALVLDFDGVIVDSEPAIMRLTQQMAAQEGWTVSDEEYYRDYLAFDDWTIVEHLYSSHGKPVNRNRIKELVEWKAREYQKQIQNGVPAMDGAVDFVRRAARSYPLAIASGSLRSEIEPLLRKLDICNLFQILVTADDCMKSKPDPEGYLKALDGLRKLPALSAQPLLARECLAVEDAPGGIAAAHAAGIKCLALAHSRPATELREADWIFEGFSDFTLDEIACQFC